MHEMKSRKEACSSKKESCWKKSGFGNTLKEVIENASGHTIEELKANPANEVCGIEELAIEFISLSGSDLSVYTVGDYDADGIMASMILTLLYKALGIRHEVYIPRRMSDGYGISEGMLGRIGKADVVVAVDNGIAAGSVLGELKRMGKKILVIDHHEAPADGILPDADLLIDPVAEGIDRFTHYCAAGLCYKLAEKLHGMKKIPDRTMEHASILAMIGTIADVMPLVDENRTIVRKGLLALKNGGWKQLSDELELSGHTTARDIAFGVAPMVNAAGRLRDDGGQLAYSILLESIVENNGNLSVLNRLNEERKKLQKAVFEKAKAAYESLKPMYPVMLKIDCPEGLVGIIAGKLAEETGKPAFIFTGTETGLKGSARSGPDRDFHVKQWLDEHESYFGNYGGHAGAAGMSMALEDFERLRELCAADNREAGEKAYYYDLEVTEQELPRILSILDSLEPFGEGCPRPVLKLKLNLVERSGMFYKVVGGGDSIRMNCQGFSALGFHMAKKFEEMERPFVLHAIGTVRNNYFMGKRSMQFELVDFKPDARERAPRNKLLALIHEKAEERSASEKNWE